MSLPFQNVQHKPSRSPSKSSLRRISVGGSTSQAPRSGGSPGPTTHFAAETTQHHFLPHSPPNQNLDYEEDEATPFYDEEASYQAAPQPQKPFQPFFALIEDTITNEHFHPTVHYIFADDEPDIVTEAACRSLELNADEPTQESTTREGEEEDEDQPEPRLPPAQTGVTEHYLILDVVPTTSSSTQQSSDRLPSPSPSSVETAQALNKAYPYTVTSAQSLSGDWQIMRTHITDAPTINAEQQDPDEQHLMLRIEGRGNSPDKLTQRRDGESVEDMVDRFRTRLAEIRQLMDALGEPKDIDEELEQEGGDMFTQGGLVGIGFQPTGFGNAVLDEQD